MYCYQIGQKITRDSWREDDGVSSGREGSRQPSLSRFFPVGCSLRVFPEVPRSCRPSGPQGHSACLVVAAWRFFFFSNSDSDCSRFPIGSPSDQTVAPLPVITAPPYQTGVLVVLKMPLCLLWGERRTQAGKEEKTGWAAGVGSHYVMGWGFS